MKRDVSMMGMSARAACARQMCRPVFANGAYGVGSLTKNNLCSGLPRKTQLGKEHTIHQAANSRQFAHPRSTANVKANLEVYPVSLEAWKPQCLNMF